MAAFPLLNLPSNLQEAIVSNLELPDQFLFSQCSKKAFDIVRTAPRIPLFLKISDSIATRITLRSSQFIPYETESFDFELQWYFYNKRDPESLDLENPRPYKVYGLAQTIPLCQDSEAPREFRCASYLSPNEIFLFTAQILKLFSPEMDFLSINSGRIDLLTSMLSLGALTGCGTIFLDRWRLTHEEMNMVLGIQAKELNVSCRTDKGFRYDKEITVDSILLYRISWINLVKLDCKKVSLPECELKNQDFNTFIRHWLNGTYQKLEFIVFWNKQDENDEMDLAEIVEGLPTIPGSLKRQEATSFLQDYALGPIAYENGFDFKRESDGMLATATVTYDGSFKFFLFVVWHDPNPYLLPEP